MSERRIEVLASPDRNLLLRMSGTWRTREGIPTADGFERALAQAEPPARIGFDTAALEEWDSSLVLFVERVRGLSQKYGAELDRRGLPEGVQRLLTLAETSTVRRPPRPPSKPSLLVRIGTLTLRGGASIVWYLAFIGGAAIALGRMLLHRARYRVVDVVTELQAAGIGALSIVSIVGFLLGTIIAFVSAVTLRPFGTTLYIADAVTVGMVRELGPIMTAIVMAGRTGSAYAAQLGTMKVTEEIEALITMGLEPTEFLVVPRLLALTLMMPLLVVYADLVAMLGGALVAATLPDLGITRYVQEARAALPLRTFWIGLGKSVVFGGLVTISGCAQGLRAGRSAAAVGRAATNAVVQSIVWIIAADGIFAVLLDILGW